MKFKVFVARPIPEIGIKILKKAGLSVEVNPNTNKVLSKKELIKKLKNKDALLSLLTDKIDKGIFDAVPNLKIVSNYAVGFDNIDLKEATKHKVAVTNTPGILTEAVAEHTFALMMAVGRSIVQADKFTRKGKYKVWQPKLFLGPKFKDQTLGIVGLGRIGTAVAERAAKGMGMKVVYYNLFRNKKFEKKFNAKYLSLNNLLKKSDVISLHVPLTKQTRHLIGKKEFSLMKKSAILINTSRGPVIQEKYLIEALRKNKIFGAGLDVFECEPEITCKVYPVELKDLDNVVLTPHIASATYEARNEMARLAAESIVAFSKGKTLKYLVNKDIQ